MATHQESLAVLEKVQDILDQISHKLDEIDERLKQTRHVNEEKLLEVSRH